MMERRRYALRPRPERTSSSRNTFVASDVASRLKTASRGKFGVALIDFLFVLAQRTQIMTVVGLTSLRLTHRQRTNNVR